ncbi:uncharacterized protein DSM5745_07302 [Aspergillus mulundensis]|uniref:Trichothecene 3-O-acetyltransferase-like N-terminal domain-containing protein n=1 Tax=Aspergillus mulundensis TaxID=1810919 RepID=A0A3D8RL08_9EURO|nr:hypothetical protein DSM5745_07302 [Aspergillus mulundensis]RDW74640.1 hypothetical protein DSM5745_07302 [Aspergillus mulundensis]
MPHIEKLTPLDAAMPRTYIRVLLVFHAASPSRSVTETLQDGLDKLSEQVPWLSGRVFATEGSKGCEIRYEEGDRAPLLVDKGTIARAALDDTPPEVWPVSGSVLEDGAPVFAASIFRFTPLPAGANNEQSEETESKSVGLCVCIHHNAVDATGLTEIIKLWAENVKNGSLAVYPSAGGKERRPRPVQLSEALSPDLADLETSGTGTDDLLALHPEYSALPPALPSAQTECTSKLFTISTHWLNTLKQLLHKHTPKPPSTNTLLCALLWTTITRVRSRRDGSLGTKTSRLVTAVNGRSRLNMTSHSESESQRPYLGNAVLYALTTYPAVDLASSTSDADPDPCAYPMRSLAAICEHISASQGPSTISKRHIAEVYALHESARPLFPGWDLFGSRDVVVTSWADQGLYEVDFGEALGCPGAVRLPGLEERVFADGVVLVLPRCRGKGEAERLEVSVMLRRDDMVALEGDSLWQTLVSV